MESGICPGCQAENAPMGVLGNRVHYQCRYCGLMYSHEMEDEADESETGSDVEVGERSAAAGR